MREEEVQRFKGALDLSPMGHRETGRSDLATRVGEKEAEIACWTYDASGRPLVCLEGSSR